MSGEVRRRLAVAAVGIPLCVLVVWSGGLLCAVGLSLLAGQGMREYVTMFRRNGERPFLTLGVLGAAAFPLLVYAVGVSGAWPWMAAYLMAVSLAALFALSPEERPVATAALTAFGVVYVGGLLSFAVPLRVEFASGRTASTALFFLPVAVTWLSDTSAYFGGKALGRRPLAPRVSPHKTVAGAVAAVLAGLAGSLAYGTGLLPMAGLSLAPLPALVLGLLVATAAVLGDLAESVLKRECGVKDSGGVLPGHGGILDRMDSLLWVFPVTYLFLRLA